MMGDYDNLRSILDARSVEFEAERLILEASELILETMEQNGVTHSDLARKIRKTKGHVSQLLDGERNMTLRTLAEIAYVLGCRVELSLLTMRATNEGHPQ